MFRSLILAALVVALPAITSAQTNQKIKTLIVDGQNNHKNWPDTTKMMKKYLEDTKRFTVEVATTARKAPIPTTNPNSKNTTSSSPTTTAPPGPPNASRLHRVRKKRRRLRLHPRGRQFLSRMA
jgi:hypothetical protein